MRTPALLLQSARDALVPRAVGAYLNQHLRGSQLVVLDALGHCPHLCDPQATTAAIEQFLAPPVR